MTLWPVILCGGQGTRLWPLSREGYPKQFLSLVSDRTLLQDTISRLDGLESVAAPVVVCNEAHRFLVMEQIAELGRSASITVLEPVSRNTAPALSLAALALADVAEGDDPDPVMLAMPADHIVRDVPAFQAAVCEGVLPAEKGCLVTFGIVPSGPETGYGYIRKDAPAGGQMFTVSAFVEKPDAPTAQTYMDSGEYLWNSGMFMMRASVWQQALAHYRPDIAEACRAAYERGHMDNGICRPDRSLFTRCPSESIDYAVMEKAAGDPEWGSVHAPSVVVALDAGWSDVGSWFSLWDKGARDAQGNLIQGDVYANSARNNLLLAQHRLLAAVGLEDTVVVETADAVLVAPKDRAQEVRELVALLKAEGRSEQAQHRRVHRPWGSYEVLQAGPGFQVKQLTVTPGAATSLQSHQHRAEHWVVVSGTAKVVRDDEVTHLSENESTFIPLGAVHRLANPGETTLEVIEVQLGSYLGEDDIVRLEDDYNRHQEG